MLIAQKDLIRRRGKSSLPSIKAKLEDIYKWVEFGYQKIVANPNLIFNCFKKAGLSENFINGTIEEEPLIPKLQEISLEFTDISLIGDSDSVSDSGESESDNSNKSKKKKAKKTTKKGGQGGGGRKGGKGN